MWWWSLLSLCCCHLFLSRDGCVSMVNKVSPALPHKDDATSRSPFVSINSNSIGLAASPSKDNAKEHKSNGLGKNEDEQTVAEIMRRRFSPAVVSNRSWECFHFAGHEIKITEATDCYGAVVWPSALVLCHFLETNAKQYSLVDKSVIEIGAGTGLVSIVASLLGAHVTATDLPEVVGNLQYNILKNTKMKCKHQPQVKELSWGVDLEKNFPTSLCQFDYIMAADVVYYHPFLEELLLTFHHLCQNNTVILWAMKFRLDTKNQFMGKFQELFDLEVISNFPSLNITLYKAMRRGKKM